jgi:hypothetical protein
VVSGASKLRKAIHAVPVVVFHGPTSRRFALNALGRRDAERRTFEVVSDEAQGAVDWNTFFAGLTADAR